MNHRAWLELIKDVLYYTKHISAIIYNRSTRDHEPISGLCVSRKKLSVEVLLGIEFIGSHREISDIMKRHVELARHRFNVV